MFDNLDRLATKDDLSVAIDTLKRDMDMRFDELRHDTSKVAEGVAFMTSVVRANQTTLEAVVIRLDRHEDLLKALVCKHGV